MNKGRKIIAAVSVFTLLMGMQVNAAENEVQTYSLPGYASLSIGGVQIVSWGEITGEMPENVSYDAQANVLTLDNYISAPDAYCQETGRYTLFVIL